MPSLRIVVIGKNESKTLKRVLQSVLIASKNFENIFNKAPETIYVDSMSTDNSLQIVKEYNISFKIIYDNPNPAKARNAGLQDCCTDYIFFLDGDTEVDPMWLVEGVSFLEKNKEIAGVGGMLTNVFYSNNDNPKFVIENYRNVVKNIEEINDSVGGTFLYRTICIRYINGFNEFLRVSEEFELILRLLYKNQRVVRIKKKMATHHDYKTKVNLISFFRRNLFTYEIFTPGYVIVNVPKNKNVIKKILFRYSYQFLYIPIVTSATILFYFKYYIGSLIMLILLIIASFFYKKFDFKRSLIAIFSNIFFSFGLYAGIVFYYFKKKSH
ncbi:MAG: glycosyltransferase family 2 protein [Bacteroidales bacterium]|nr:glycosyltransferase family 2 protein [Bacteroidales bacterium]